nr:MAG TPA: hypothetical protein [Caudoviricetes sp.]
MQKAAAAYNLLQRQRSSENFQTTFLIFNALLMNFH